MKLQFTLLAVVWTLLATDSRADLFYDFDSPIDLGFAHWDTQSGDVNGDGVGDLIQSLPDGIHVHLGPNLDPVIASSISFTHAYRVEDLDGDGRSDLVGVRDGSLEFLIADPTGALVVDQVITPVPSYHKVVTADADADGDVDVLGFSNQQVYLHRQGPDSQFLPAIISSLNTNAYDVVTGDFDQDGWIDFGASAWDTTRVYFGQADGTFVEGALSVGTVIASGDLDQNGTPDLVLGDYRLIVWFGNGDGTFVEQEVAASPFPLSSYLSGHLIDLDADGDLDLAFSGADAYVLQNNGLGLLTPAFAHEPTFCYTMCRPYDFDDDGRLDLAVVKCLTMTPILQVGLAGPSFRRGDVDGDGARRINDVVLTLSHIFEGASSPCLDAVDSNDDGQIDLADAVYLATHLFSTGSGLPAPSGEACGSDPTEDPLDCEQGCQ